MSFNPQEKPKQSYDLIEEGLYAARLGRVIELGDQEDKYGIKSKVVLGFFVPDLTINIDGEEKQRMVWTSKFGLNQTSNPDSTLMKYINAIDGSITHMSQLLGKPCMIEIKHTKPKDDGTVYANISNVTKPMRGLDIAEPDADVYMFEFDKPDPVVWEKLSDTRKEQIMEAVNYDQDLFTAKLKQFVPDDEDIPF